MGRSPARSFRDLDVYRLARALSQKVFQLMTQFPREEKFSLTDQMRRSARAVNAMIAEAWARRRYEAAFINKLNEALGESMETQAWLDHAIDCGYLTNEQHTELDSEWQHVGAMLSRMIDLSASFCQTKPTN
ncbi:MAG: four helix bundle protein [Planctomycetales bacterium]